MASQTSFASHLSRSPNSWSQKSSYSLFLTSGTGADLSYGCVVIMVRMTALNAVASLSASAQPRRHRGSISPALHWLLASRWPDDSNWLAASHWLAASQRFDNAMAHGSQYLAAFGAVERLKRRFRACRRGVDEVSTR